MDINSQKNFNLASVANPSPYQNWMIEAVLLVVASVLVVWFLILPKQHVIADKKTELEAVTKEEASIADDLQNLKEMSDELGAKSQTITDLDEALPLEGKVIRLQTLIEALAKSTGAVVGDINVSAKGDSVIAGNRALLQKQFGQTRTLQKLSGSVYVIGSYIQLKAFLQKLEKSARIFEITDLSLDAASDGNLNLKLTLNAYYLAP